MPARPNAATATWLALLPSLALLPGCAQWGGQVLEDNHVAFNTSVAQAMDRQLLLNLVRLAEDEPTQWMAVTNITVNTSVGASVNGSGQFPAMTGTAGGSASFTYTPTIQFVPRQGDQLAREMMSPIPVTSIENMVSAGWPISWLLFLTCERCQTVWSFDVTKGFGVIAQDKRFGRLLTLCDSLQDRQMLSLSLAPLPVTWNDQPIAAADVTLPRILDAKKDRSQYRQQPDGTFNYVSLELVPVLTTYPGSDADPLGKEFHQLLDLKEGAGNYRLMAVERPVPGAVVSLRPRSLAAVLRLLSFGVDSQRDQPAPPQDADTPGDVWTSLANADGTIDVERRMRGVFRIRRGGSAPSSSEVSVQFNGDWYWIASGDRASKQIFSLVRDLFDLQVKTVSEQGPVLTVPVGR